MGNILFGILFIIGGATGTMVLRGTHSTVGLMVVGAGLVLWGIMQVSSAKQPQRAAAPRRARPQRTRRATADGAANRSRTGESVRMSGEPTTEITPPSPVRGGQRRRAG